MNLEFVPGIFKEAGKMEILLADFKRGGANWGLGEHISKGVGQTRD